MRRDRRTDFQDIARASRLAVVMALRKLERKGFPGEAARAHMMIDRYIESVRLLFCNNPQIVRDNRALKVVRSAAVNVRKMILEAELAVRTKQST